MRRLSQTPRLIPAPQAAGPGDASGLLYVIQAHIHYIMHRLEGVSAPSLSAAGTDPTVSHAVSECKDTPWAGEL